MIDQIFLARVASERLEHYKQPFFEAAAVPALVRRPSYNSDRVIIQVPKLQLSLSPAVPEEEKVKIMIYTGEFVAEEVEPLFAFCKKINSCGHACKGVAEERNCLPCIDPACAEASGLFTNVTELCTICYTTELGDEACSKLGCGHVYHTRCVVELLEHKWATLRISFAFMSCPKCKESINIQGVSRPIAKALGPLNSLKQRVEKQALENAEKQGLLSDARLAAKGDAYFGKPQEYALHRCSFYECYPCKKPYFGGLIDCE